MKYAATALAFVASAGTALAGGIERSSQDISAIFESGNYAELSFGSVTPNVTGTFTHPQAGALASGNVAKSYMQYGGAIKFDLGGALSMALIADQPYGAKVSYDKAGYPLFGTRATIDSFGLTALARYQIGGGVSVYGGLSYVNANASVKSVRSGTTRYMAEMAASSGTGYVIGAAYERPEIAMRAALTYRSAIKMSHDVTVGGRVRVPGGTKYSLPQSLTLDLQSGIAANTMVMAQVRWVDWTATNITGPNPANAASPVQLISYKQDTISYSLGIGHRFNDKLSGSATVGWERSVGGAATNLAPTDGSLSFTVGAKYNLTDTSAISAGVSYVQLGNATTETLSAKFSNNSAIGFGLKYSFSF